MYVAVRDAILTHAGYATIAEGLADLGVCAVELAINRDFSIPFPDAGLTDPRSGPDAIAMCRQAYHTAGVRVSGLLVPNNFNAADIEPEIEWVASAVRIADRIGADAVRIDSAMTGQNDVSVRDRVRIYASAVSRVLDATEGSSMAIGIENHGIQGNDPEWIQGVLDAVGSERVGLTLDTGNFYWAGHPLDEVYRLIEQFAPYVKHVHCKNLTFKSDQRQARRTPGWDYGRHVCPVPDGDIDHARIVGILTSVGYAGGLNIEDESLSKFEGDDRRDQLRRGVDHLARLVDDA